MREARFDGTWWTYATPGGFPTPSNSLGINCCSNGQLIYINFGEHGETLRYYTWNGSAWSMFNSYIANNDVCDSAGAGASSVVFSGSVHVL